MALTKENLAQLVALQEKDAALDVLKAEMGKVPVEIAAIKADLERGKGELTDAKNQVITFEKRKKEKELELAQKEEAARKHGTELNQVKTNEAFKALQNEIDAAKRQAGELETEILEAMEGIDQGRQREKAAAAAFKAIEAKAAGEISVHESKLKELQGRFDAAAAEREESAKAVPAEAMRVYNHVRSRGKLNAVVAIEGDRCSACMITLAPQVIVEATKSKQLVVCESCQRILFLRMPAAAKAA